MKLTYPTLGSSENHQLKSAEVGYPGSSNLTPFPPPHRQHVDLQTPYEAVGPRKTILTVTWKANEGHQEYTLGKEDDNVTSTAISFFFASKKQFFPPGYKEPITTVPPFSLGGQKHKKNIKVVVNFLMVTSSPLWARITLRIFEGKGNQDILI